MSAEKVSPDDMTVGSKKLVHWVCSCLSKRAATPLDAAPTDYIGRATGCAVCAGKQACLCNSVEALFSHSAAELDVDKNGFAPSEVTAHADKKVWWRDAKRGS